MQKQPPQETSKLTVAFSHPWKGWVHLALLVTEGHQNLIVNCSSVFEPFSGMNRWLHEIADGSFSAAFQIDEEGRFKRFIAERPTGRAREEEGGVGPTCIEFRVEGKVFNEAGELQDACFVWCRLERAQMLQAFVQALEEWLDVKYDSSAFTYMGPRSVADFRDVIEIDALRSKLDALPP